MSSGCIIIYSLVDISEDRESNEKQLLDMSRSLRYPKSK